MSGAPEHIAVQRAIVKMLYDPQFAARVRSAPDEALAGLSPARRQQLAAVDPRALTLDPLRQQKLLRSLFDELKGSLTLALAETRAWSFLEGFFASAHFHRVVDGDGVVALAMAAYLGQSKLVTPALRPLLEIERAMCIARRDRRAPGSPYQRGAKRLRLAPGVLPVRTTKGALAALATVEKYLFESSLIPALALCDDAPRLVLPAYDAAPRPLVIVPFEGQLSLVEVDDATVVALLAVATGHPVSNVALLDSLGESELVETAP